MRTTELFEVLVHVLFDGVMSILLGRDFLSTDTAELDKFSVGRARRVGQSLGPSARYRTDSKEEQG